MGCCFSSLRKELRLDSRYTCIHILELVEFLFNKYFLLHVTESFLLQVHDLKESDKELKLILQMYRRESITSRLVCLDELLFIFLYLIVLHWRFSLH